MRKLLRKYHQVQRCTCAFLVLYLIHAFSITSLVAAPSSQTVTDFSNTTKVIVDHEAKKHAPKKNKNKPYSLFIAKHGASKITRSVETLPAQVATIVAEVFSEPAKTTFFSSNISPSRLSDDAYKRYCKLRVFLI